MRQSLGGLGTHLGSVVRSNLKTRTGFFDRRPSFAICSRCGTRRIEPVRITVMNHFHTQRRSEEEDNVTL
jgi:hypothetical protein